MTDALDDVKWLLNGTPAGELSLVFQDQLPQELGGSPHALRGARFMRSWADLRKVFGPAWLVMMADVDAASIITAMQTGASFKYEFIIILLLLILPLYFICEVAGRLGSVTRKGLGQLIRENFSRNVAVALSFPMAATDFLSYVAEYTGIAVGMTIIGISPFIALPIVYMIHILIVYKKTYASAEKVLLAVSMVMVIAYCIARVKVRETPVEIM